MRGLSQLLNRAFAVLSKVEDIICYTAILTVTFLVFFKVLNRYLFRFEIMWIGDFTLYLFIFYVFAAILFTTRENGHTSVEVVAHMIYNKAPQLEKPYTITLRLVSILTACIFTIPVFHFAARSMKYPQYGTLCRWFNTSWLMQAMFVMIVLVVAHLLRSLMVDLYARPRQAGNGGE
ncbi:MAG: TRAP transporter small permease subunit [Synergistales bacterium]|nr:TRAP transporter small permease subunit [Synergistales bacterium]